MEAHRLRIDPLVLAVRVHDLRERCAAFDFECELACGKGTRPCLLEGERSKVCLPSWNNPQGVG